MIDIHYAVSSRSSDWRKGTLDADTPTGAPLPNPPLLSPPPPYVTPIEASQTPSDSSSYTIASPVEMDYSDRISQFSSRSGLTEVAEEGDVEQEITSEGALALEHHGVS